MLKQCKICKEEKPTSEFHKDKSRRDGRHPYCKTCNNTKQRSTYSQGAGRWKSVALANAKRRAEKLGVEFNLTKEDIHVPDFCPVLGIKIEFGVGYYRESSPALDRVDNSKGYVKENVVVMSWRANRIKSDATFEELEKIVNFMSERKNS